MKFNSTDPVERFLIELRSVRDKNGRLACYKLGDDLQDEIRIARILVAKMAEHTLLNTDPSKFMSHQEGFDAGVIAERQAIGEDIMEFYKSLVKKGDPAKKDVEHCLSLIRQRSRK